jgi:uncharacterized protein YggL (DUF469 family)
MKKRLRKKLHEKEFTEYGIRTIFSYKMDTKDSPVSFQKWVDAIVEDLVEENGMVCGGGFSINIKDETFEGDFVIELKGAWVGKYKEVQKIITTWMTKTFEGISVSFSPINLWHPDRKVTDEDLKRPTVRNRK